MNDAQKLAAIRAILDQGDAPPVVGQPEAPHAPSPPENPGTPLPSPDGVLDTYNSLLKRAPEYAVWAWVWDNGTEISEILEKAQVRKALIEQMGQDEYNRRVNKARDTQGVRIIQGNLYWVDPTWAGDYPSWVGAPGYIHVPIKEA